jgi:glycosyltransferase involved in cell wall biosynthesis
MKILFATMQFGRGYSQGTERYLTILSRGLRDRGHETVILAGDPEQRGPALALGEPVPEQSNFPAGATSAGPRAGAAENTSNGQRPSAAAAQVRAYPSRGWTTVEGTPPDGLVGLLEALAPDVVHIANPAHVGLGLVEAANRLGLPVVVTIMDYWWVCPKQTLLHFRRGTCDGNVPWRECIACIAAERGGSWRKRIAHLPVVRDMLLPPAYFNAWRRHGVSDQEIERWKDRRRWIAEALGNTGAVIFPSCTARQIVGQSLALARTGSTNSPATFDIPYGLEPHWFADQRLESEQDRATSRERQRADDSEQHTRLLADGRSSDQQSRSPEGIRIGYAGALAPHKGVHLILEALQELRWGRTQVTIAGGGDTDYVAHLKRIAAGLDVTFAGFLRPAEMPAFVRDRDVMIVPSLWPENLPITVLESYAVGVPVLASRVGGIAELVPARDTFDIGSSKSLAACLREWVARSEAPSSMPHVSTADEMIVATMEVYSSLRSARAG